MTTSAMTPPSLTDLTTPTSWFLALSMAALCQPRVPRLASVAISAGHEETGVTWRHGIVVVFHPRARGSHARRQTRLETQGSRVGRARRGESPRPRPRRAPRAHRPPPEHLGSGQTDEHVVPAGLEPRPGHE